MSMPGVPHEMKGMMTDYVLPRLQEFFTLPFIDHRTLLTVGIGESFIAEHIQHWEAALPSHLKLAYLPNYGMVRLRITGHSSNDKALQQELDKQFTDLKTLVKEWMVADEDIALPQAVGNMVVQKGSTVGTAESCTGGYIAHLFTSLPGSSAWYKGSVVSYSNEVKKTLLGVSSETLDTAGAVSEETVKQMLQGALQQLKTDYAVATSGIMGPDGGTPEKPVGTVWIAAGSPEKVVTEKFSFRYDRARNIEMAANFALNMLRKIIVDDLNG